MERAFFTRRELRYLYGLEAPFMTLAVVTAALNVHAVVTVVCAAYVIGRGLWMTATYLRAPESPE